MRLRITAAVASILLFGMLTAAQVQYFPAGVLGEDSWGDQFLTNWYSKHLTALEEPSLWEMSKNQKTQSYRFLWLRTFDHPISVRIFFETDGSAQLITKVTSGSGGYEPGHLMLNRTEKLTKQQAEQFLRNIEELHFWRLPTLLIDSGVVGADGARWIIEGIKDGNYHILDRWSPNDGEVRTLGLMLAIDLAKLKLKAHDIY